MKKIWSGLLKWAGVDVGKERENAQKWNAAPAAQRRRGIPRWGKRKWHPDVRMRRGISLARERKQRPARLAFIAESQRQGIAIANKLREKHRLIRFVLAADEDGFSGHIP